MSDRPAWTLSVVLAVASLMWGTNEDNINEFVTRANHYHDTVKFTAEISESEIAFLDTKVTLKKCSEPNREMKEKMLKEYLT